MKKKPIIDTKKAKGRPKKHPDEDMTGLLVRLPKSLHRKFQLCAVADDKSMSDILEKCVKSYVKRHTEAVLNSLKED